MCFHWVMCVCVFLPLFSGHPCHAPLPCPPASEWQIQRPLDNLRVHYQRQAHSCKGMFKEILLSLNRGPPLHWSVKYSPDYTH